MLPAVCGAKDSMRKACVQLIIITYLWVTDGTVDQ